MIMQQVLALYMFLMVSTTLWLLVSDWSKRWAVLNGTFSAPPKGKLPITFDLLCKIHPFVNFRSGDDIVYWTATTCGHFLLLRTGQFTLHSNERFHFSYRLTPHSVTSLLISSWTVSTFGVRIKQSNIDQRRQGVALYMSHTNHSVRAQPVKKCPKILSPSCR